MNTQQFANALAWDAQSLRACFFCLHGERAHDPARAHCARWRAPCSEARADRMRCGPEADTLALAVAWIAPASEPVEPAQGVAR